MPDQVTLSSVSSLVAGQPAASTGSAPATATQAKAIAAQFESMLISQMMNEMRSSIFDDGDNDGSGMGDNGPLADTLFSELGLSLSKAGGLGLGNALSGVIARQTAAVAAKSTQDVIAPALAITNPTSSAPDVPVVSAVPAAVAAVVASAVAGPTAAVSEAPVTPVASLPAPASMISGRVSSSFGYRNDPINGQVKFHSGTDLPRPYGSEVDAVADGTVESVGNVNGYGLSITIAHANGVETRYAHLSAATVKAGDTVTRGQKIGEVGSSGRSTGPHLHFEVINQGQPVDPASLQASMLLQGAVQ